MKNRNIVKNTPFGYKTCREFFENIVELNFNKIKTVKSLDKSFQSYYNFIFSAGALRDWIIKEFNFNEEKVREIFWEDKYYTILHSIYNNSKHYTLDNGKRKYNLEIDGKSLMPTDENGHCIWTNDMIWDDSALFLNRIAGESNGFNYVCVIKEENTGNCECCDTIDG